MASAKLIERILLVSRLGLRQITLLYRFEVRRREVWLLGVDSCVLVRLKLPLEGKAWANSPSLLGLVVRERRKPAQVSPSLPSPAARFYGCRARNRSKPTVPRTIACKYAWGHSSGDTFVLDSLLNKQIPSRDPSPKAKNPTRRWKGTGKTLKTNESAFFEASFDSNSGSLRLNKSLISLKYPSKQAKKGTSTVKSGNSAFDFISILPNFLQSRAPSVLKEEYCRP